MRGKVFKKSNLKYLFLLIYFFYCLVLAYNLIRGDSYVNFGFSYAITRGEVPYVDFNLVIPPLAPWLYSSTMVIFHFLIFEFFYFSFLFGTSNTSYFIFLCFISFYW